MFALMVCAVPFLSSLVVSICLFRMYLSRRTASDIARIAFESKVCWLFCRVASFAFQTQSLVFIGATPAWTALSLVPYRLFLVWNLHAGTTGGCHPMWLNWTAWSLAMLLASSPVRKRFVSGRPYTCEARHIRKTPKNWLISEICEISSIRRRPCTNQLAATRITLLQMGNCLITWLTYAPYRAEMTSILRRLCTKLTSTLR